MSQLVLFLWAGVFVCVVREEPFWASEQHHVWGRIWRWRHRPASPQTWRQEARPLWRRTPGRTHGSAPAHMQTHRNCRSAVDAQHNREGKGNQAGLLFYLKESNHCHLFWGLWLAKISDEVSSWPRSPFQPRQDGSRALRNFRTIQDNKSLYR